MVVKIDVDVIVHMSSLLSRLTVYESNAHEAFRPLNDLGSRSFGV